jgi:hypothetical protein
MKSLLPFFFLLFGSGLSAQNKEAYYDYLWKPVEGPSRASFYSLTEKKGDVWHQQDYFISTRTLQMDGYYLG